MSVCNLNPSITELMFIISPDESRPPFILVVVFDRVCLVYWTTTTSPSFLVRGAITRIFVTVSLAMSH